MSQGRAATVADMKQVQVWPRKARVAKDEIGTGHCHNVSFDATVMKDTDSLAGHNIRVECRRWKRLATDTSKCPISVVVLI